MASEKHSKIENEFEDLLKEFDDVMEDFETLTPKRSYDQHLKQAKKDSATSMGDSSFNESVDSGNSSPGSSLNNSEENLTITEVMTPSKAKLGDTSDLESYIENLDRVLDEMWND
ncbi:regulator of cell cycle RGCC-like [Acipenser oxyrinchus oxyrinchus]|uniref:Regulator of cell cycle RGCC-like n=1 Tax=Acipenser oxyrinchus oxyrinchus TaxID=40147 RepID=A0AAD8G434_ACIOX|nr:regulator of cell cycle RGCC-like [Acipenser oxyrinchus oxyrinchus]